MNMIALYDAIPSYCPQCGTPVLLVDQMAKTDALNRCSHKCRSCGLGWQLADRNLMLDAAEQSGGDMGRYHE